MTKPKWFSLLILAFGVMVIPGIVSILFAIISGKELGKVYDLSEIEDHERIRFLILVGTHWIYALLAIISAAAIFAGKPWASRFWFVSCVVIFVGVLMETVVFKYEWDAFWFEAVFAITSLLTYRSDHADGLLQNENS